MTCAEARDLAPAYVLGALEQDELEAVRAHLATCPEAHEEFAELGEVAFALAESVELVEPPPALRDRVMAAARRDLEERALDAGRRPAATAPGHAADRTAGPATPRVPDRAPGARPLRPPVEPRSTGTWFDRLFGGSPGAWAMRAVAVVAVIGLVGWNVALQNDLAGTRSYQSRLDAALALARQPGSQVAFLSAPEGTGGPHGIAVMPPTGPGRLVLAGLRPNTGTEIYEAWAIHEGESPIPIGGFRVGADGVGYFDQMPAADGEAVTVAVTLEPRPEPSTPSLPILAIGHSPPSQPAA